MILVIDNYDSFVHNVARHLVVLDQSVEVVRNDAITVGEVWERRPKAVVVSPGPCSPEEAGVSCAIFTELSGRIPLLGVCLGHQCLGAAFGGRTERARHPLHGEATPIRHTGTDLFTGLPDPLPVGRYHSLIVAETPAMRETLRVTASSPEGEIMALCHRDHPTWGVQFHPESILTPNGLALFANFISLADAHAPDGLA